MSGKAGLWVVSESDAGVFCRSEVNIWAGFACAVLLTQSVISISVHYYNPPSANHKPTNTHINTLISCLRNKQPHQLNQCYPQAPRFELPCIIKPKCTEIVSIVKHCGLKRLLAHLATHAYTAVLSLQQGDTHCLFPLGDGEQQWEV